MIPVDPKRALEHALPMVVRQQMPAELLGQLEERISTRGFFGVLGVVGQPGNEAPLRREVRLGDERRYQAHTHGARLQQPSTHDTNLTGIAMDRVMALDDKGFRILEIGERPDPMKPAFKTCPVSGKSVEVQTLDDGSQPPIDATTPAVEIAGEIHYLCDGGHIHALAEGGSGGPTKPTETVPTTQSTGVRTVLYMRVAFPETHKEPQTEAAAYDMMRQVNDFVVENSYGNVYLLTTVTPLLVLPRTEAFYKGGGGDEYTVQTDAQLAARRLGYDSARYDHDVVAYNGGPGTFGGLGYVGSKGIWLRSITVGIACHEFGHNFGLWHANFWNTGGASTSGSGTNTEYGHIFDTMGPAIAGDNHFNTCHKAILNWLPRQSFVQHAHTSGTYRIHAFDQSLLDPQKRYALSITKDGAREYWAEFRQKSFGENKWVRDGILLNWNRWADSNQGAQLLDTTPGSAGDRNDAAIVIGRTYSDYESGVHITPIGKGGTSPESMDVVVNLGAFTGNHPPVAIVAASTLATGLSSPVDFTVSASDVDGDSLSYAWDYGDGTFSNTNSPAVSKSWPLAGEYVVRCVVSDMKGFTASDSVIVRIDSPSTYRISGLISLDGEPLANVRVGNGLSGSSYSETFSDGDGSYTLPGLAVGSVTLEPALHGYTFAPAFANPATVGPDFTGADFAASRTVTVSLTVNDADCAEGGANPGSFRFTRTGPTDAPLAVTCFNPPKGSAVAAFDYGFAPTPLPGQGAAATYYTATIPAGQASLDVIVTAADDTQMEGPEVIVLELVPRSTYGVFGSAAAVLTIQDEDSALPSVTLRTVDGDAHEGGGTASFLVQRTGATTASLTVSFTVAGTATAGSDYANIGTQITIPAGALSVPLLITPVDDAIAETTEIATVSLIASASYIPSGLSTENAGTVNIVDNDLATVTVTALDDTASEAGGDPGTFLITRTGSLAQPLTVNYALGGSATHGVDYERLPGVLAMPTGSNFASVTITPIDDLLGEPSQTVSLQLRGGIAYAVGAPGNATLSLIDDGDPPVITVGTRNAIIGEPSTAGTFRFTTTGTGTGNITVRYAVTGTALPGVDYILLAGDLIMGRNATAEVTVTPIDDQELENVESITVTILPDVAYSQFLDATATLQLADDDRPTVNISTTNASFVENSGMARFWISRTGPTNALLNVNYSLNGTATNGADYLSPTGTIDIPAGAAGIALAITAIDDALAEGTETLTVTIEPGPIGTGIASATHYLTDNDASSVQVKFSATTSAANESAGALGIPVVLTAAAPGEVKVEYVINGGTATGGLDFTITPGVLVFAPGETSMAIPLAIIDDGFHEPNETVVLRLINANGATLPTGINSAATHTLTINANDSPPVARFAFANAGGSGPESQAAAPVFVSLNAPQTVATSIRYSIAGGTATSGVDYTLSAGTLAFAAGDTAKAVPHAIINDTLSEPTETLRIALDDPIGAALGANANWTYTIFDDDAPGLTISASDAVAGEFGGDLGMLLLTRTGTLASAITAGIAVAGTAIGGKDFQPLPAAVVFIVGQESATMPVTPIADNLSEGDETVAVTITSDGNFNVGTANSATVTIRDLAIDGWRFAKFGTFANNPLLAGDTANPDLDAFPNLLEFALASEPSQPGSATSPIFAVEGTDVTLTYTRPSVLGDVSFTLEKWVAPDHWPAVNFTEEIVSDDGIFQVVKDRVPANGATEMMLRLRVSRPAP